MPAGQWASAVVDFSTEYSSIYNGASDNWDADQALGEPNTMTYGDIVTAWAPLPINSGGDFDADEHLTLRFANPVNATGVLIRETYGNGFVYQVDFLSIAETGTQTVYAWTGTDPSEPGSPVDFTISIPPTIVPVNAVKIYVNIDHDLNAWEEIDAVRLLDGDVDTYPAYLLAVSQANQVYSDAVLTAAAARNTAIYAARAAAQSAADQLYADYLLTASQANQTYVVAVASAEAAYQSAVQSADAVSDSSYTQARSTYDAAITSADSAYASDSSAADQTYQNALTAADAAYAATLAPYQAALDQAVVDAQSAQSAFGSAEAALSTTIVSADADRTASQSVALVVYQTAQSQAAQDHTTVVDTAATARDAALTSADAVYAASVDPYQAARDQAYADYLANPDEPATQSALNDAESALSSAISQATGDRNAAQATALSMYDAALASAEQTLVSELAAAAQNYQDALATADATYVSTVAPYQSARDQADAANQSAQAALTAADSALTNALASATSTRDQAYADALTAYQANQAQADQNRVAALDAAIATFHTAFVATDDAWTSAVTTAWNTRAVSEADADAAVVGAEETAWNYYVGALATLESNLESAEAAAQNLFDSLVAAALSNWSAAEQTAWDSYTAGMATIPGAPALGQRIDAPTAVVIPALEAFVALSPQPRQEPVLLGAATGRGAGHHFIPIAVIDEFIALLTTEARDLALGWISGQTSPNHLNTTITGPGFTITHGDYTTAVSAEMRAYRAANGIRGRMTRTQMEAFITHLQGLPGTHVITRYNAGIQMQRAAFLATHAGALAAPSTTAGRIARGRTYLSRLAPMILMVAASEVIAQYAQAVGIAANSRYVQHAMQALSEDNIMEAQSPRGFGISGGGGFIGELTDNSLLGPATTFETRWLAALERARQRAEAINRGN